VRSCLATGCGGFLLAVLAAVGIVGVLGYAAELGSGPGALVIATAVVPALIYIPAAADRPVRARTNPSASGRFPLGRADRHRRSLYF
jgi:hypothetical protein